MNLFLWFCRHHRYSSIFSDFEFEKHRKCLHFEKKNLYLIHVWKFLIRICMRKKMNEREYDDDTTPWGIRSDAEIFFVRLSLLSWLFFSLLHWIHAEQCYQVMGRWRWWWFDIDTRQHLINVENLREIVNKIHKFWEFKVSHTPESQRQISSSHKFDFGFDLAKVRLDYVLCVMNIELLSFLELNVE